MSNNDFLDLILFLAFRSESFEDDDWTFDEEWEDGAEEFYNQGNNNNSTLNDDDLPF